jgi:DNA-binding MltR family transcriptional regulator
LVKEITGGNHIFDRRIHLHTLRDNVNHQEKDFSFASIQSKSTDRFKKKNITAKLFKMHLEKNVMALIAAAFICRSRMASVRFAFPT